MNRVFLDMMIGMCSSNGHIERYKFMKSIFVNIIQLKYMDLLGSDGRTFEAYPTKVKP